MKKENEIEEWEEFDIREGERLVDAFIRNYCNDHQQLRWLRGAFYNEDDKMNTIISWLRLADHTIDRVREETNKRYEEKKKEIIKELRV